jgi:hypothetical protein
MDPIIEGLELQRDQLEQQQNIAAATAYLHFLESIDAKLAVLEAAPGPGAAPQNTNFIEGPNGTAGGLSDGVVALRFGPSQGATAASGGAEANRLLQQIVERLDRLEKLDGIEANTKANVVADAAGLGAVAERLAAIERGQSEAQRQKARGEAPAVA